MSTTRPVRRFVPLAALLVILAGCASVTPIGDLLSNSSKYNGKTVRVKGEVSKSAGAVGGGCLSGQGWYRDSHRRNRRVEPAPGGRKGGRERDLPGADHHRFQEPGHTKGAESVLNPIAPHGLSVATACPDWVQQAVDWSARYASDDSRMSLAIELSRQNVLRGTGGPFGAAVFESDSGALVAVGVNSVVRLRNSVLHAEIVALMLAEHRVGSYTLQSARAPGS